MAYTAAERKAYRAKRYRERKQVALNVLGDYCIRCGSKENLQIDHINPTEKKCEVLAALYCHSLERFLEELSKCQHLCEACHSRKTILDRGNLPAEGRHGTLTTVKYCKCKECVEAKRRYNAEYSRKEAVKNGTYGRKKPIAHGTRAGYLKEKRRGMEPCAICRIAHNRYMADLKKRLAGDLEGSVVL